MSGSNRPPVSEIVRDLQNRLLNPNLDPKVRYRIEDRILRLEGQLSGGGDRAFGLPKYQEPEKISLRQRMDLYLKDRGRRL